jgi:glutamate synthase (NADPH/NADH) large chain
VDAEASRVTRDLYDARFEHDSCGVAFVADIARPASYDTVDLALTALENLAHRGAFGADTETGDGAGITVQLPHDLLSELAVEEIGLELPGPGRYATGIAFLSADPDAAADSRRKLEAIAPQEGLAVLGWREVPVDLAQVGRSARDTAPSFWQVFVTPDAAGPFAGASGIEIDRSAFVLRKRFKHGASAGYFASLSARTLVYKGMLSSLQLRHFYRDLSDQRLRSKLALVHSRFSTNTFPSWPLAHPYRLVAHNGEINTLQGNRHWMQAREALLESPLLPGLERALPVCSPGASDSASFDEVLELLHLGGRSLPHAVLMMIPEAWENNAAMDEARRAFYRFHASLMEPWDGPAALAFTDGNVIGAVLDRNGLRPARYWVTSDGIVVLASEVGVLDVPPERIVEKGRLQPGRMLLVDTGAGRVLDDDAVKAELAAEHPYGEWLAGGLVSCDDLPPRRMLTPQHASVVRHQRLFGVTSEELRLIVGPMARTGHEPIGSMGTDTPVSVLSAKPRLLYDYFTQLFAQVTNPPLDAIREELVTSLGSTIGPEANLLAPGPESCRQIVLPFPVIDNDDLAKLLYVGEADGPAGFKSFAVDGLFPVAGGGAALAEGVERVCGQVSEAIALGADIVVLSDRNATAELAPVPSLLLTSAVHHHLVRERTRTRAALLVESGDAREVHHMALLIGYGAAAVNPYLVFESLADMAGRGDLGAVPLRHAARSYVEAAGKGVLKVMSKMGISTIASYTGAQVFEAVGLAEDVVERYFSGTVSRIGGVGLDVLAEEVAARHRLAFSERHASRAHREIEVGGDYQWRQEGEHHLFNPRTVMKLQHATRSRRYEVFKEYTRLIDEQSERLATLRGLMRLRTDRPSVPIEEVEGVAAIVKRFATGAMSYGSISAEAHETLAVAMNRLGGKSNTGEGGEDPARFVPDPNGDSRRSAVKQVASGRFGVTSEYLVNADDLQIKMAQGAKPGEGGQLPGHKVYPWIAATRHSTPGVGLISPPPHHDIYSIEDLAQLIFDLRSANPAARIHVKLVSEAGVGTVAAGVAKAHADVVLISGHDGGTGAAPLTSLKHAGTPWELGLAETQQTLLRNGLRARVVLQTDGQLKTGRDVVIAALLGAEEFGFATAPLVVSGCVMMRVCHLDTCPVGIATQNPELRKRFTGRPEFVETFFEYVAEEVREHLAALGYRTLAEAVGQVERLDVVPAVGHWKAAGLDLSPLFAPPADPDGPRRQVPGTALGVRQLEGSLDEGLLSRFGADIEAGTPVSAALEIRNVDRAVGTRLGNLVTRAHGEAGLPPDSIDLAFCGSAGQSFGAFVPRGMTLRLEGDANDFLGKGLSGGRLVVRPPAGAAFLAEDNVIAGNVVLYGATAGDAYLRGRVGERFCVRNSGAAAVVEGVGDHGCEYMTGGRVLVLGPIGRNFAAGMSGGIAYLLDPRDNATEPSELIKHVNPEMVDLAPLDEEEFEVVLELCRNHAELTGSAVAGRVLADPVRHLGRAIKVMPRDYQRVLEATRSAAATGRPVDEVIMASAHG